MPVTGTQIPTVAKQNAKQSGATKQQHLEVNL